MRPRDRTPHAHAYLVSSLLAPIVPGVCSGRSWHLRSGIACLRKASHLLRRIPVTSYSVIALCLRHQQQAGCCSTTGWNRMHFERHVHTIVCTPSLRLGSRDLSISICIKRVRGTTCHLSNFAILYPHSASAFGGRYVGRYGHARGAFTQAISGPLSWACALSLFWSHAAKKSEPGI
jgi:hypothetical protein